jgi:putative ABC transport system permease protein
MILIMSWRNIWRHPMRSLVVIGAIAIGVWAALFMTGFASGMVRGYIDKAVTHIVSHIQAHHPEYEQDYDVNFFLSDGLRVAERLREHPEVVAISARTLVDGMISSTKGARGVRVKAVNAAEEADVSQLDKLIVEGEYFGDVRRNELLISQRLAEKLDARTRSRMVVTFQDLEGEIISGAFRVVGLFDSGNTPFDEAHVFMNRADLNRLLHGEVGSEASSNDDIIHEIAVMLSDPRLAEDVKAEWTKQFPGLLARTYQEVSPDLELYESQMNYVSLIYLAIIMLALTFGIINTMLMAVLERVRELGMLMAIGMNKLRVFLMIVLETVLLGLVGAPMGIFLGALTIAFLGRHGIDFEMFSTTMKQYGMPRVIYLEVASAVYWQAAIAVALTAVLAALYPAFKAIQLRPMEAIRKI